MSVITLAPLLSPGWLFNADAWDLPVGRALTPRLAGPVHPAHRGRGRAPHQGQPVAQVRGILAERVVVSTPLDPFVSLKALAAYSGLSVRKLRDLLTDPVRPLPHYRVGGKIVVRRSEFDTWMAHHRRVGDPELDRLVTDALDGLR